MTQQLQAVNRDWLSSSQQQAKFLDKAKILLAKLKRKATWEYKEASSLPSKLAGSFAKVPFIEKNILYPRYIQSLKNHESKLPTLDSRDLRIVEELEKTGIYMTSLESLGIPNTQKFLKAAKKIQETLAQNTSLSTPKASPTILATPEQLMEYPEIFYWGLEERLLKIAERYLGVPVAYDGILFTLSLADGREHGVRVWHRDQEDRRMLRVCLYINDVDEDGGPFQYLRSKTNELLCNSIQNKYISVNDEYLQKLSLSPSSDSTITCTGSAGTVIFVDTARNFHRGKPPTQLNRYAVFFTYFSRRPWHPYFCQRSVLSGQYLDRLTERLPAHQRACVHWTDSLSKLVKWIPKKLV
ncbi:MULTISPECIES: hypothetical protein [unclassified Coleofasciculus]|uniref:hypothetical protein n=1 Tax=unclassified Coleofasciculus TaxID=2692782 RepID=UPI0018822218|nr:MULTISPECIES: hypothetical protein [unclassified Coleofasciculus]MBE9125276.1 hypothetical protein [Coleofasciculus sp. LEGE 07081]MBE9147057.1 hypothetical protein [Coleofasciculus sp. LEGE 07092]